MPLIFWSETFEKLITSKLNSSFIDLEILKGTSFTIFTDEHIKNKRFNIFLKLIFSY